ncbi:NADH-quinone oxidoreductase subunit G [Thermoflexales bacterium]|nr:NADH-quinone oxidoreductase subunit G [Thermoflexales bacterium]
MIKLTIDNQTVEVPEGTTVLEAAEKLNIRIPKLCHHPAIKPYGSCRLCVVEVEGFRTIQASCTLPAGNGMVVRTDTPALQESRHFVLSMLFSERNHFCPFCQVSGGDCELQNAAYDEGMTHWPIQPQWSNFPVDTSHPYYVLDNNRCILCRRCVRACGELVGNFTLAIEERGSSNLLIADVGVPLGESTCIQCGTCVQVCPTGALIDRTSAYHGLGQNVAYTSSICVGCSVGCNINVVTRDNRLVRIEGDFGGAVNGGVLCEHGRYYPMTDQRERLTQPLLKKNGKLEPASWDEALTAIADRVKPLVGKGAHSVVAIASTRLPAEALSIFKQLFGEGIGSRVVTSVEEGLPTARSAELAQTVGAFEAKLEALKTSDAVITIGVDLSRNHQVAGFFAKRIRPQGVPLIVIDPNENGFDPIADVALKPEAGKDADTIGWLLAAAKGEAVSDQKIGEAAQLIKKAQKPVIVYGKGLIAFNEPIVLQKLIEYARAIGASLIGVKGEANSFVASQYQLDRPFALNGQQAAYVAIGDDYVTERLLQRLEKAPFIIAQASYASKLTALADVVLPVTIWAEQSGHYVNLEGRVQQAHAALVAAEGVRSNAEALQAVAESLGVKTMDNWKDALFQRKPVVEIG